MDFLESFAFDYLIYFPALVALFLAYAFYRLLSMYFEKKDEYEELLQDYHELARAHDEIED